MMKTFGDTNTEVSSNRTIVELKWIFSGTGSKSISIFQSNHSGIEMIVEDVTGMVVIAFQSNHSGIEMQFQGI